MGSDGVLSIENSNTMETSVEVEEGMSIDRGYVSREMITNQARSLGWCAFCAIWGNFNLLAAWSFSLAPADTACRLAACRPAADHRLNKQVAQ